MKKFEKKKLREIEFEIFLKNFKCKRLRISFKFSNESKTIACDTLCYVISSSI